MTATRLPVKNRSFERRDVFDLRLLCGRECTNRHDKKLGRPSVSMIGVDRPFTRRLVPPGRRHASVKANIAPEVEAIGDVIDVGEDLGLRGVLLAPVPLLFEVSVEGIGVVERSDIASGPWVPVPPPRPANVIGGLNPNGAQPQCSQAVVHIEARESSADNDDVG